MDTLTHALSGALLARATAPTNPSPRQLPIGLRSWVGFCAAAFPDSDFVINFFDSFAYLTEHRGVTHSIILLPLWAALLSGLFTLFTRRRYPWTAFLGICALGIGSHIAFDVITAFGTMIFAPLSNWRAQFPTTFIIDVFFTGIIVIGLLVSLFARNARVPAVFGVGTLAMYIGFQALLHARAVNQGAQYAAAHKITAVAVHALPQPLSPFNWMLAVQEPDAYHIAYVNLLREQSLPTPPPTASWFSRLNASYRPIGDAQWKRIALLGEEHKSVAEAAWQSPALEPYRHFAMLPAVMKVENRPDNQCAWFHDLRFVITGRENAPFRFGACRESTTGPWRLFQLIRDNNGNDVPAIIRN